MSDLAHYLPNLLVAYGAYLVATISPAPSNLAIMGTAMRRGRRQALALAAGVVCGSFIWAILAALGVPAILASYAVALTVLKIVGGLYLLYLAYRPARSALRSTSESDAILPRRLRLSIDPICADSRYT